MTISTAMNVMMIMIADALIQRDDMNLIKLAFYMIWFLVMLIPITCMYILTPEIGLIYLCGTVVFIGWTFMQPLDTPL